MSLAPNQYLEAADLLGNYSSSSYNAGSVEFRRRFRSGLNLQASYTFSKVFTDYSGDTPSGVQRFYPYLDNAQPGLERARANFDLTHAFKANFRYALPFGRGTHLVAIEQRLEPIGVGMDDVVDLHLAKRSTVFDSFRRWHAEPFSTGRYSPTPRTRPPRRNRLPASLGTYQSNGEVLLINPKYIGPDGRGAPNDASDLHASGFRRLLQSSAGDGREICRAMRSTAPPFSTGILPS